MPVDFANDAMGYERSSHFGRGFTHFMLDAV